MTKQEAIREIEVIDQAINILKRRIILHPKNADKYNSMIAEAEKEIIELCKFVFSK